MSYQGKNELCYNVDQIDMLPFSNEKGNEIYPVQFRNWVLVERRSLECEIREEED